MISQLFKVATEFRFEIGSAMFASRALQDQVEGISDAAQGAEFAFKKMAVGAALSMGVGSSSMLGVMQQAIMSSDKFRRSQLQLSQIFAANQDKLTGPVNDFNSRLQVSEQILKRVAKISQDFSLDEGAFADTVKMLGAVMISKGLAGNNMENAIQLGRGFLKTSPILGIDPTEAQGQLVRSMTGQASMGDTMFRRLTAETSAMAEFGGKGGTSKFNSLGDAERVKKLTEAFMQFAKSNDELDAQANTLQARLTALKNTFSGLNGIIKPLGDVILPNIVAQIKRFTEIMDKEFRVVFMNIAKLVKPFVDDLRGTAINLLQAQKIARDTERATKSLGIIGIASMVLHFVSLGRVIGFLGRFIGPILTGLGFLVTKLGVLSFAFKAIGFIVSRLFLPFAALLAVFQIISRAQAIAKIRDLEMLPKLSAVMSGLLERASAAFQMIISPIMEIMNFLAEMIAPLFQATFWLSTIVPMLEFFVSTLENIAKVVLLARAGLEGLFWAIFQFIENIAALKFMNLGEGVGAAFNAGIDSILAKHADKMGGDNATVSTSFVNIGKVEINNKFKEGAEPDRVAFSLTEQLMNVAKNPTQALNRGGLSRGSNGGRAE